MLEVLRSNDCGTLAASLCAAMDPATLPPTGIETVVVSGMTMRSWAAMAVARQRGVCMGVEFPFLRAVAERVVRACEVVNDTAAFAPWHEQSLIWSLLYRLRDRSGGPWRDELASLLDQDTSGERAFALARNMARCFDQYAVYRPELLARWTASDEDRSFQAALWRDLSAALPGVSFSAAVIDAIKRLEADAVPSGADLPDRVHVLAPPHLAPLMARLLYALSLHRPVRLFLLTPTPELLAFLPLSERGAPLDVETDADPEPGHPLLASWAGQHRDMQGMLEELPGYLESDADLFRRPDSPPLLARIQRDLTDLHVPQGEQPAAKDDSIAVHVCHGPLREVEVLAGELRRCFEDDPSLHPHEVAVLLPNVERYAPFIEAVFGGLPPEAAIPWRINDRSIRRLEPVADAFLDLLRMATSRVGLAEVFDFLSVEPVAARFNLTPVELATGRAWLESAGVRWGIDGTHRAGFGQPPLRANTFAFGIDRLLLGRALPSDAELLFAGAAPLDALESSESAELAGRLFDALDVVFRHIRDLVHPRSLPGWREQFNAIVSDCFIAEGKTAEQTTLLRQRLHEAFSVAEPAAESALTPFAVVRDHCRILLEKDRSSAGQFNGGVTFGNCGALRGIPFRVIGFMGLQNGAFPRMDRPVGFDRMADNPRATDPSLLKDDRALFLETIMAAREKLIITYSGRDPRDGGVLPPSVLLEELYDVIDRIYPLEDAPHPGETRKAARVLETVHPLQPFSSNYFYADSGAPTSFDPQMEAVARALASPRRSPVPFIDEPLPSETGKNDADSLRRRQLRLDDLLDFFRQPALAFLRRRLGVRIEAPEADTDAFEPLFPNQRQSYTLRRRILDIRLRETNPDAANDSRSELLTSMLAQGLLPPSDLSRALLEKPLREAEALREVAASLLRRPCRPPEERTLPLGETDLLVRLDDLRDDAQVRIDPGSRNGARLVDAWIRHLALTALNDPALPRRSVLVLLGDAKDERGAQTAQRVGLAVSPERARRLLQRLLNRYEEGLRRPPAFDPDLASDAFEALTKQLNEAQTPWDLPDDPRLGVCFHPEVNDADLLKGVNSAAQKRVSSYRSLQRDEHPGLRRVWGRRFPRGLDDAWRREFAELAVEVFAPLTEALAQAGGPENAND